MEGKNITVRDENTKIIFFGVAYNFFIGKLEKV